MRSSFQRRLLASTLLLGLTTPAFAQTADDADEGTIVVTGSRIARPDLQQASPIAIVHNPPGDRSFSSLTSGITASNTLSTSVVREDGSESKTCETTL